MEIVKDIEIDIGHRITQHESKCKNVHGHRLRFCIHATASKLDSVGRIVDFGVLKGIIGKWLNDNLDHVFVANPKDEKVINFLQENSLRYFTMRYPASAAVYEHLKATSQRPPVSSWFSYIDSVYKEDTEAPEPTSENLARMVFEVSLLLSLTDERMKGVDITRIECWETPTSSADFTQEDMFSVWSRYMGPDPNASNVGPWWSAFLPENTVKTLGHLFLGEGK